VMALGQTQLREQWIPGDYAWLPEIISVGG